MSIAAFHRSMPGYRPTPLTALPDLARQWGVAGVAVKDESRRMGLPAFKILGASWATNVALAARLGRDPFGSFDELCAATRTSDDAPALVTATDGNHGRALAHLARLLGLPARIYVPGGLPAHTPDAIASEGAEVIDTGEVYDRAVSIAAESTIGSDVLIQDTAWDGYETVPHTIVDGYSTLFTEIDAAADGPVTAIAVPTGVGSLLQAALAHYRDTDTAVLAVEPVSANCVARSLAAGHPVTVDTSEPTTMAGLNCGTVSTIAWPLIKDRLDAAVGVDDAAAERAAELMSAGGISAGPCGAASVAGFAVALNDPALRADLALTPQSRLVALSTEGAS